MTTKQPRELKIGDRVKGTTNRGNAIAGKVAEFRTGVNGQRYIGVQESRGAALRFTRASQLQRV